MDLEVFKGATSVDEAFAAAKRARAKCFRIYVDLHTTSGHKELLAKHGEAAAHSYANQINQAITSRGGFPEHMARKVEEVIGVPYGFFEQPYPPHELWASMARAKRIMARVISRGEEGRKAVGMRNLEQVEQACKGERGVSEAMYRRLMLKLAKLKRVDD